VSPPVYVLPSTSTIVIYYYYYSAPKADARFTMPQRVEGCVDLCIAKVCKAAYRSVSVEYRPVTDRRRDSRTDRHKTVAYTALCSRRAVKSYVLCGRLSGLSPFMGDDDTETLGNVIRGHFSFDFPEFDDISADATDIIYKLLVTDKRSDQRISTCTFLCKNWQI